jgi:flagellar hook-length control protein FliK
MVNAFAAQAPAAGQRGSDSVALSGPPTAWRQSLHEALGERLDLQLGNRMEQAVIRLEPPQLGRIEIAIRHSEGSLQVTLSATHNEVLRQLQGVSDNLRNDLAQRQYTDVAVTVAPAPRNAAANPFGGDAQGRGRQPGQEQQERGPGLALLDADAGASAFSLTGRE